MSGDTGRASDERPLDRIGNLFVRGPKWRELTSEERVNTRPLLRASRYV